MAEAYIVEAVRTPVGRRGGGLSEEHPADLGAHVLLELMRRSGADPAAVEDVVFGCVDALGPHLRDWGWKGTVDELLTFWFESEHHTDAHMIEIIGSIRGLGIRCFLATNQEQRRVDYMREKMGFGSVFDKLYSSAGIGHLKSDEEFFRIMTDDICENFLPDLQPGEVAFFDDSLGNVEAAQRFGIQASLFTDIEGFQRKLGELGVVMSD